MRAFADAWQGTGTGRAACRSAGYGGGDRTLDALAPKLLRDERIRARILERLPHAFDDLPELVPAAERPLEPGLVKGRGRGTATERVELAMGIARSRKVEPQHRIAALRLAAELELELRAPRPARGRAPLAAPPPASDSSTPTPSSTRGLRLVVSDRDRGLEEPGHG